MDTLFAAARAVGTTMRLVLLAILSLMEPAITWSLTVLMILLAAMIGFFTLLAKSSHFPLAASIGLIAGIAVFLALYYSVLGWLAGEE